MQDKEISFLQGQSELKEEIQRSLSEGVQAKKRIKGFGLSLKTELRKKLG
jgi:hypothetical protein